MLARRIYFLCPPLSKPFLFSETILKLMKLSSSRNLKSESVGLNNSCSLYLLMNLLLLYELFYFYFFFSGLNKSN